MQTPLFYGVISALNSDVHKDLRLREDESRYEFARTAHLIPALVEEFSAAANDLPVAFLAGSKLPNPVFVAGLAPGNNLFLDTDGAWNGSYVPAYLRRYPFIIGEVTPDADGDADADTRSPSAILCVDEGFDGLSADVDAGRPLFDRDGSPSEVTTAALELSERYRVGALRTDAFSAKLQELNLLRPVTLDVKRPAGQSVVVHGLLTIEAAAFDALSDDEFLELRRLGYLQPIYAHFQSLRSLDQLSERLDRLEEAAAA